MRTDSLAELTYSRNLLAGDYIRGNGAHHADLEKVKEKLDRKTGDYNQFWHDRNYLLNAHKVKAEGRLCMVPRIGMSNHFMFTRCFMPFLTISISTFFPSWCPCLYEQLAVD